MAKIKFLTDSASDITEELEKRLDIQIMNFKVAMGDDSYTSRIDFDNEKFYKMLDDFDGIPVTSQITAFEYQETFEKLYSEGSSRRSKKNSRTLSSTSRCRSRRKRITGKATPDLFTRLFSKIT